MQSDAAKAAPLMRGVRCTTTTGAIMRALLTLVFILSSSSAMSSENFCDTGKPHQIDLWYESAMKDVGGITVNIRNVQSEAYARWDKVLNRVYSDIMAKLNEQDKVKLRDSQRAWIKFRDAEVKWLWSGAMYGQGGTLAPVIVSDISRGYVRQRVCDLMRYNEMAYEGNS